MLLTSDPSNRRQDGILQHAPHFMRHAGHEEKNTLVDAHFKARGRSHRVVDPDGCLRKERLFAVLRAHGNVACGEESRHLFKGIRVELEFNPLCLGRRLAGDVVPGRSQATGNQGDIGPGGRFP